MIVNAISESIDVSAEDLTNSFLTLVERHVKKEASHPRSLKAKAENHTTLKQGRNVRGLHKSSKSTKSSNSSKMERVDSTQEKIENFMASSEELG